MTSRTLIPGGGSSVEWSELGWLLCLARGCRIRTRWPTRSSLYVGGRPRLLRELWKTREIRGEHVDPNLEIVVDCVEREVGPREEEEEGEGEVDCRWCCLR